MKQCENSSPENITIWSSTQCWQRGRFAKPLGRRNTTSEVGTHLLRHNIKKRKDVFIMKRKYIKALKDAGIRYADKNGAKVQVKHLKTYQAINLYYANGLNEK